MYCPSCNQPNPAYNKSCDRCGAPLGGIEHQIDIEAPEFGHQLVCDAKCRSCSKLEIGYYIFSGLSLLVATIFAIDFLPGDPGEGRYWKLIAYSPAITAFTIGFVLAGIFTAMGRVMHYLSKIEFNTRRQ